MNNKEEKDDIYFRFNPDYTIPLILTVLVGMFICIFWDIVEFFLLHDFSIKTDNYTNTCLNGSFLYQESFDLDQIVDKSIKILVSSLIDIKNKLLSIQILMLLTEMIIVLIILYLSYKSIRSQTIIILNDAIDSKNETHKQEDNNNNDKPIDNSVNFDSSWELSSDQEDEK